MNARNSIFTAILLTTGLVIGSSLSACANNTGSTPFTPPGGPEQPKAKPPVATIDPFEVRGRSVDAMTFQHHMDDLRVNLLRGTNLGLEQVAIGEYRFREDGKWIFAGNSANFNVNKIDCDISTIDIEVKSTAGDVNRILGTTLTMPYWIEGVRQNPKMIAFTMPGIYRAKGGAMAVGTSPVLQQAEPAFRPVADITLAQNETVQTIYFDIQDWDESAKTMTIFAKFFTPRGTVDVAVLKYGPSSCRPN